MNVEAQIAKLDSMTVGQLKARYRELFGEDTRSSNGPYLRRRLAWQIQAKAEGGFSERVLRRVEELANEAELRVTAPKHVKPLVMGGSLQTESHRFTPTGWDRRLPPPGSHITRDYKGRRLVVVVLADGDFEFEGRRYRSLSAVAKVASGSHVNGFSFFNLNGGAA